MPHPSFDPVRPALRAAAEAFIPEVAGASPAHWDQLEGIVAGALAARPLAMRRQLLLFIRTLDLMALARYGRRLGGLDLRRRTEFLDRMSRSPLLLVRRGVWGLRTLVQMGWYAQPEVQQQIGYRAHPAGWEARR